MLNTSRIGGIKRDRLLVAADKEKHQWQSGFLDKVSALRVTALRVTALRVTALRVTALLDACESPGSATRS